jgi:hypothetical protein
MPEYSASTLLNPGPTIGVPFHITDLGYGLRVEHRRATTA